MEGRACSGKALGKEKVKLFEEQWAKVQDGAGEEGRSQAAEAPACDINICGIYCSCSGNLQDSRGMTMRGVKRLLL